MLVGLYERKKSVKTQWGECSILFLFFISACQLASITFLFDDDKPSQASVASHQACARGAIPTVTKKTYT